MRKPKTDPMTMYALTLTVKLRGAEACVMARSKEEALEKANAGEFMGDGIDTVLAELVDYEVTRVEIAVE